MDTWPWHLALLVFAASFLYSTVGHGGGSAYLAILVLVDLPRTAIAPVALSLNILVSSLGSWNYGRAGHFSFQLLAPFVAASVPAAFLGGSIALPPRAFAAVLGVSLLLAAVRLLWLGRRIKAKWVRAPGYFWPAALILGFGLGFLAGLIGIGGGIFLSPLILLLGWADAKRTAAVSAAFVLLNSASGLSAHALRGGPDLALLLPLLAVVAIGGSVGSRLGAYRFSPVAIQRLLGGVLLVASFKLLHRAILG